MTDPTFTGQPVEEHPSLQFPAKTLAKPCKVSEARHLTRVNHLRLRITLEISGWHPRCNQRTVHDLLKPGNLLKQASTHKSTPAMQSSRRLLVPILLGILRNASSDLEPSNSLQATQYTRKPHSDLPNPSSLY